MLESVFWVVSLQRMKVFSDFLFAVLAENFQICRKQKYTAYDRFHGNGPYGKIPTKNEPIRTRGFTSRLPCHINNSTGLTENFGLMESTLDYVVNILVLNFTTSGLMNSVR